MQLLVLLMFILPVLWLFTLRSRLGDAIRRKPLSNLALVLMLLVGGWMALNVMAAMPEKRSDYAAGDAELRAMLE